MRPGILRIEYPSCVGRGAIDQFVHYVQHCVENLGFSYCRLRRSTPCAVLRMFAQKFQGFAFLAWLHSGLQSSATRWGTVNSLDCADQQAGVVDPANGHPMKSERFGRSGDRAVKTTVRGLCASPRM